jgi:hypothetical protein
MMFLCAVVRTGAQWHGLCKFQPGPVCLTHLWRLNLCELMPVLEFERKMSVAAESRKPLRMVSCRGCGAKIFISGDLPPLSTTACTKCGHELMMPMQLRQFELRAPIASGGMGTVYRSFDVNLEREVAVKLMKRELKEDPQALESFYREARAAAALNHSNIIHVYTFDELEHQLYLVMELADAGSLDSRIERERRVPELDVLDISASRSPLRWAARSSATCSIATSNPATFFSMTKASQS